jgi:glycosyltransferase involved in cell wall biosynthesis
MTLETAHSAHLNRGNGDAWIGIESPVRVLHLIHTIGWGGVETGIVKWLRKIDSVRFQIYLACFSNHGGTEAPFVNFMHKEGWPVEKIPWGRRKPFLKAAKVIAGIIRDNNIQIIHAHGWYADMTAVIVARIVPVKIMTTIYLWADLDWKRNILQQLDKVALRFFDQITVHCDYTFKRTVEMGIARPEQLRKLISGFELRKSTFSTSERLKMRREKGIRDDELLLMYLGRFYSEKAQDQLLRIFRKVAQSCPGARLWILGDGPMAEELQGLSRALEIDHAVSFLGFVPEGHSLLPLADIYIHPSTAEGVSQAIGESMAAGIPIVVSDVGGLREVLTPDKTGILVPAGDEDRFAQAVLDLIENKEKRNRLGNAARKFIEDEYSMDIAIRDLQDTYCAVVCQ